MNAIRLVLADDHATIREALKLLLSGQPDLKVVGEAVDGQQAIDAAVALKPDVLLMDVSMPGINGLQATAAVRQRAPGVKVLTLTRHAEESYLGELLRAGAAGYALKQSSSAELINAIRTVASGRPYLDPELNHGLMGLFVQGRTFRKPPDLTPRETEVLRLTAWGYSNKEIASRLGLSVKTVEVHKTNGMRKLGMNSRLQLVRYALLRNWFQDIRTIALELACPGDPTGISTAPSRLARASRMLFLRPTGWEGKGRHVRGTPVAIADHRRRPRQCRSSSRAARTLGPRRPHRRRGAHG